MKQKLSGEHDFAAIPGGMPGVEDRAVLVYTYGVVPGRISLSQMCRLLSENPAKLYGLYPRKGRIEAGGDADIVVFDPTASGVISAESEASKSDYAPYEGFKSCGRIERVYLRGRKVIDKHEVLEAPQGIFLKRDSAIL